MTQLDSRVVRELECVESWALVKNSQQQPRGIHSVKTLSCCEMTSLAQWQGQRSGRVGHHLFLLSAPYGLLIGLQNMVDYQCWPGTNVQNGQCWPHSVLRAWTVNWAPRIFIAQTETPSLQNHRKVKNGAQPPSASRIPEDLQNLLGRFKISKRHFFSFLFFSIVRK